LWLEQVGVKIDEKLRPNEDIFVFTSSAYEGYFGGWIKLMEFLNISPTEEDKQSKMVDGVLKAERNRNNYYYGDKTVIMRIKLNTTIPREVYPV